MSLKPLRVKKSDNKDTVTGVYVQAPSSKKKTVNPVPMIVKINGSGVPIGANPVPVSRDDRMSDPFRGLENVGLTAGGTVMKVQEGAGFNADLRAQLASVAEKRWKNMVVVDQIAPLLVQVADMPEVAPLLVQVADMPEVAPAPVEVAVELEVSPPLPIEAAVELEAPPSLPVEMAGIPNDAPSSVEIDATPDRASPYHMRPRKQKNVDEESAHTSHLKVSKGARHAFGATIVGKFGM
jgi:hypothetical protein